MRERERQGKGMRGHLAVSCERLVCTTGAVEQNLIRFASEFVLWQLRQQQALSASTVNSVYTGRRVRAASVARERERERVSGCTVHQEKEKRGREREGG